MTTRKRRILEHPMPGFFCPGFYWVENMETGEAWEVEVRESDLREEDHLDTYTQRPTERLLREGP